jgi:outer membrane protein TolC
LNQAREEYAHLALLQVQLTYLDSLQTVIRSISLTIEKRVEEGHEAGIAGRLVQSSLDAMRLRWSAIENEMLSSELALMAMLGLSPGSRLLLTTSVGFQMITLPSKANLLKQLSDHPAIQRDELQVIATQHLIDQMKGSWFPSMEMYGGIKQVSQSAPGYITGVSIPLPFTGKIKAGVVKAQAQNALAETRQHLNQLTLTNQVNDLVGTVYTLAPILNQVTTRVDSPGTAVSAAFTSYQEGWLSLTDLLNAIQIETEQMVQYYDQLYQYLASIIKLEQLTGITLLTYEG